MTESVHAWSPDVPLVREVLHATFEQHAYPSHTHDDVTVLLIDAGAVAYDLHRSRHYADASAVTILPPHVPHNGRSAVTGRGFRKRVLYLDPSWLSHEAVSVLTFSPTIRDPRARMSTARVHAALQRPGDALAAEYHVLALADLVEGHVATPRPPTPDAPLARRLRLLLDERLVESFTLAEAARVMGAHPSHLVRAFSQAYGIPPHQYVIGRRVDRARRMLLAGRSAAETAAEVGFHDQAHLTRHFRRVLGTTPRTFAA